MPLSGSHMSTTLQGLFAGRGYSGISAPDFADAIGIGGIDNHVVGKPFTTTDSGTKSGTGAGAGVGVTGLQQSLLSAAILASATFAFGQAGSDLPDIADDLATAFIAEMGLAQLTSTHTPIYAGTGTVDVGSIGVVGAAMGAAIELEGVSSGFLGANWGDFADVIGAEFANELIARGTGSVTITGGGSGDGPGVGTGTGVFS